MLFYSCAIEREGLMHIHLIYITQVLCCMTCKSTVSVALHVGSVLCQLYKRGPPFYILHFYLIMVINLKGQQFMRPFPVALNITEVVSGVCQMHS